jgi:hypothetical protein
MAEYVASRGHAPAAWNNRRLIDDRNEVLSMPNRMIAGMILGAVLALAGASAACAQSVADADNTMRAMDLRLRALTTARKNLQQMTYQRGDSEADAARDVVDADNLVFTAAVKVFTVAFFVKSMKSPDDLHVAQQQFRLVVGLFVDTANAQLPRVEDDLKKITAPATVTEATGIRNVMVDLRDFLKPFAAEQ